MKLRFWGCWPLIINTGSLDTNHHDRSDGIGHWKPKRSTLLWCKLGLDPRSPSSGRRLWIYAPTGRCWNIDFVIDRRVFDLIAVR